MRLDPVTARLVREAAVMGFVQGSMHGRDGDMPSDSVMVANVLRSAHRFPDLYPALSKVESIDEAADAAEAEIEAASLAVLRLVMDRLGGP